MSYPALARAAAGSYLAEIEGGRSRADGLNRFVESRGDGAPLDEGFVTALQKRLGALRQSWRKGLTNVAEANHFEGEAAGAVHEAVSAVGVAIADPDFWVWLAVGYLRDTVEWRYQAQGRLNRSNLGLGGRAENFIFRLWLRADVVLGNEARDRYRMARAGQIDFYRSHLFRQRYANTRPFARAFLRFQYPHLDDRPRLDRDSVRALAKRLRRLCPNLAVEILSEDDSLAVIREHAKAVARDA